jgi:hypothetical protein
MFQRMSAKNDIGSQCNAIHARAVTGITDPEIQNNTLINRCHANKLTETCYVTPCVIPQGFHI